MGGKNTSPLILQEITDLPKLPWLYSLFQASILPVLLRIERESRAPSPYSIPIISCIFFFLLRENTPSKFHSPKEMLIVHFPRLIQTPLQSVQKLQTSRSPTQVLVWILCADAFCYALCLVWYQILSRITVLL